MIYTDQELRVALEVKKILDEGIKKGPWQANLFLKGIKKKLEELRDQFEANVGLDRRHEQEINALFDVSGDENTEIYIALYQSQGSNIHKWQEVVVSLVHYTMGRPIYKEESDVQAAIRLTDRNLNNAYAVVKVSSDAILSESAEQPRFDREGRQLLSLRETAIQLKNVVRLVHATGHYKFVRNFLVKQSELLTA